jgi:hypothetical protein
MPKKAQDLLEEALLPETPPLHAAALLEVATGLLDRWPGFDVGEFVGWAIATGEISADYSPILFRTLGCKSRVFWSTAAPPRLRNEVERVTIENLVIVFYE